MTMLTSQGPCTEAGGAAGGGVERREAQPGRGLRLDPQHLHQEVRQSQAPASQGPGQGDKVKVLSSVVYTCTVKGGVIVYIKNFDNLKHLLAKDQARETR